jgi:RNA polymerase-binding protein DksA
MLDPHELEYFDKLIRERREKALAAREEGESVTPKEAPKDSSGDLSAYSVHMPDQGTDAMEREMESLFAARDEKFIRHLDEALERIKDGTFGTCRTCGSHIGKARLEAVPNATECITCKSQRDKPSRR